MRNTGGRPRLLLPPLMRGRNDPAVAASLASMPAPLTPDGRYIVVVGRAGPRLWRAANPALPPAERERLVASLMDARRAVRDAPDDERRRAARARVDAAKHALGERGPPWWDDGAPDLNRRLVANSPYRDWWRETGEPAGTKSAPGN